MSRMIIVQMTISVMLLFMSMGPGLTDEEAINRARLQEILRLDRGGVIRGMHFNMQPEAVRNTEISSRNIIDERLHLAFEVDGKAGLNENVEIHYNFDSRGLYLITAKVLQKDRTSATELFINFKKHFDLTYGMGNTNKNGYVLWSAKDPATGFTHKIRCFQHDNQLLVEFYVI